tara:strand:+ start:146 stop:334 length:189 start_codon:yes stop_codon:yes gene_type:complete
MAKKKQDKEFVAALDKAIDELQVVVSEDPLADKVKSFREKGYNDNQIASLFRISKQEVEKIK